MAPRSTSSDGRSPAPFGCCSSARLHLSCPIRINFFEDFRPALVERPFEDAASKPRLRWRPDWRWAVCLSLMLLIAILRIRELSPFIYFQF